MATLIAVTSCPTGIAHSLMAAEAIKKTAALMGHEIQVEIHGAEGTTNRLSEETIAAADAVLIAADIHVETEPFGDKPRLTVSTGRAIRDTRGVIDELLALVPGLATAPTAAEQQIAREAPPKAGRRIVAITACPTGIAHTFMAADALKKAAAAAGDEISVETQGSVGAKNQLTPEQIAAADLVVIAADTHVDPSRFAGKRGVYHLGGGGREGGQGGPGESQEGSGRRHRRHLRRRRLQPAAGQEEDRWALQAPADRRLLHAADRGGGRALYRALLRLRDRGVQGARHAGRGPDGHRQRRGLQADGADSVRLHRLFHRRPSGSDPGTDRRHARDEPGSGFPRRHRVRLPGGLHRAWSSAITSSCRSNFEGLKPVLVIPLLSTLAVGLLMIYVVGTPVKAIMDGLTHFLQGMGSTNAVILGLILGAMMAVDMGGPVNKAAYTFAVGLLTSDTYMPMAAVMAAGMTPPLGIAIATLIGGNRFTQAEREAGKAAGVLGLSFITEGAIPFAAKDPLRVIPAADPRIRRRPALCRCTSAVGLRAPHGGIFVLAIPNAVSNLAWYALAILVGTLLTTIALLILKPSLEEPKPLLAAGVAVK